jgi:hypothetical protein
MDFLFATRSTDRSYKPITTYLMGTRGKDALRVKLTAHLHIPPTTKLCLHKIPARYRNFTFDRTSRNHHLIRCCHHEHHTGERFRSRKPFGRAEKRLGKNGETANKHSLCRTRGPWQYSQSILDRQILHC